MDRRLEGVRVLHLTDLHLQRRYPRLMDRLIAQVQANPPDLLLITGDFVDLRKNPYPGIPHVKRFLAGLRSRCGIFGIVGNHDDYTVAYELRDCGVTFLDGKRQVVSIKDAEVELIGLPGAERVDVEPAFLRRLPARAAGTPRIVLSHHPDNFQKASFLNADLYLTGHTHGGQLCLPGGFPIITHDALPRRLSRGIHHIGRTWLVIGRGIGSTELHVRTFCPPEAIEIRLRGSERLNDDR
jgi:hypothetical protein